MARVKANGSKPAQEPMIWRDRIVPYEEYEQRGLPQRVAPDQLLAHPLNARIHGKAQQAALLGTIHEIGFTDEVEVGIHTQHVLDGHLRVLLAMRDNQPTIRVKWLDLEESEEPQYIASKDPIAAMAGWDKTNLDALLRQVSSSEQAVQEMLAELARQNGLYQGRAVEDPGAQVDRAAELQAKWQTARGQVWQAGRHRLMCGDSTNAEDVASLLRGGEVPTLTVTDPPYGVEYDPAWRQEAAEQGHLAYAARRVGEVPNDERRDWTDAWRLCPGPVIYCWHAGRHASSIQSNLEAAGFEIRCQIIWSKPHFPISRGHYHWRHEPCWYAVRKGDQAHWIGDHKQTTVWEITLDRNVEGGHSTQKPVECMAIPIRNHEGDVYDPFVGTGTTIVAAEANGRRGFGMDISEAYLAVALERLSGLGLSPVLADA